MAEFRGLCKWRLKMFCLFYLLFLFFGFVHGGWWYEATTRGIFSQSQYRIQRRPMSWWNSSDTGCNAYREKLLTLKGQTIPREITYIEHFVPGQYWIGAVAFSDWKWSDGSTLYTYKGYNFSRNVFEYRPSEIFGNSVSKCHSVCKKRHIYKFGLKGRMCYCLIIDTHASNTTGEHENPCPGNPLEKCGNVRGISIYTADSSLPETTSPMHECTYVKKEVSEFPWYFWNGEATVHTGSCGLRKCAVCYGQNAIPYLQSNRTIWNQWNRTCTLYKVPEDNWEPLKRTLNSSPFSRECRDGYWIGLRRYTVKKWLNGENVTVPNIRNEGTYYPKCLALYNRNRNTRLVWTECTHLYPSICKTVQLTPTIPSTWHPKTRTSPRGHSTVTSRTTTRSVYGTSENPHRQRGDSLYEKHSSNTGVYVGTCLGILALAGLLLFLGFSYRTNRFCFKPSKSDDQHIYFDPSQDGMVDASNHVMSQPTSNPVYCIPVATIRPTYQNPGFKGDNGGYYNVSPKLNSNILNKHEEKGTDINGELDRHYEVPEAVDQKGCSDYTGNQMYDGELENHYEVPKTVSDSEVQEGPPAGTQIYDAISWEDDELGDEEWNADTTEEQNNGIYTLAGKGVDERTWTEADTIPVNYGLAWQSSCQKQNANDSYDTLRQNRPAAPSNNIYSHITDVNGAEDGDGYDRAVRRDVRVSDGDYCHTEAIECGVEPKKMMNHGNQTSKSDSKHVGIYENTRAFKGGIYENINGFGTRTSDA